MIPASNTRGTQARRKKDAVFLLSAEYAIVATPHRNGADLSDAVAVQVRGRGMAPEATIGHPAAVCEATHGPAPQSAALDMVNPSSVMLSGVRTFEHMGWREVRDKIIAVLTRTVPQQRVPSDL